MYNLWINGTLYSSVGQIQLPRANSAGTGQSGTANFYDTSDSTADPSTILSGYMCRGDDGDWLTGSIPTKSATDVTIAGPSVTTPSGYYS